MSTMHPTDKNRRFSQTCCVIMIGCLALVLGGCAQDTSDLEQFVLKARSKKPSRIDPLPEMKPHQTFRYDATELRDPFTSLFFGPKRRISTKTASSTSRGPKPDENRPREALEAFPLDSLRMVGILERDENTWALVKTSTGTIHRVSKGNYIGQNHGKITSISETKVQLVELAPTGLGDWIERQASLTLSE